MQRRLIKGSVVIHYDGGHPELARCVAKFNFILSSKAPTLLKIMPWGSELLLYLR